MKNLIQVIVVCFFIGNCFALTGNGGYVPPIVTVTPTARSAAMGSVGYALADDETCLMFNPAGLGFMNFRWNGGAISFMQANELLPSENLYTITYQNENLNRLGFSVCLDQTEQSIERTYINQNYDIYPDGEFKFYNSFYGIGAGYRFYSNKAIDNSVGISMNYSRGTENQSSDPAETSILGNIGYILQIYDKFRIGLSFKNIEIAHSNSSDSTGLVSSNSHSPTAFCTGIGYKDSFNGKQFRVLDLSAEISYVDWMSKTLGANSIQTGCEATFFNTFSARTGYLDCLSASEFDFTFGTGLSFYNHLGIDFYDVFENHDHETRNYLGFSLSFNRILTWNKSDLKWWLK